MSGPGRVSTPRYVAVLLGVCIACALAVGTAGTWQLLSAYRASTAAADNTAQLLRIQDIQTSLLQADAIATNAFLVGGLEPRSQVDAYNAALNRASTTITDAAEAQPADRAALARLTTVVVQYAGTVEQARANNRQGLPVGAEYLRQASAALRSDGLPILDALAQADAGRATAEMAAVGPAVPLAIGVAALVVLLGCQALLAVRFRRVLNPAVVVGFVLVVAAAVVATAALQARIDTGARIAHGSFAHVRDLATAKIQGSDAKSYESLTLVAHGSGSAYEVEWQQTAADVSASLAGDPGVRDDWRRYETAHRLLRGDDDNGHWEDAVASAVSGGAANRAFTAFDRAADQALDTATATATDELRASRNTALPLAAAVAALTLAAIIATSLGFARRLEEYQ